MTTTNIPVLADVKAHLRYPTANTADDVALTGFLNAAIGALRAEVGEILPVAYDEYYDGGDVSVWLRHTPVIDVIACEEGWGFTDYELVQVAANTVPAGNVFAFSVDVPEVGKLTRRSAGNVAVPFVAGTDNIHVTYTAGRSACPYELRLAILELVAHWWQNSQQRNSGTGGGGSDAFDSVNVEFSRTSAVEPLSMGVPYRILELIKGHRRMPIIG